MADTSLLKTIVEPHVRAELTSEFGVSFAANTVILTTGGTHEFDAVSTDGRIVASIKSASGKTSGGKVPSGKIKDVEAELYYLSLVSAQNRLLVLTTPEFYDIMSRRLAGRLLREIELRLISLPHELQEQVNLVQKRASAEVSPAP